MRAIQAQQRLKKSLFLAISLTGALMLSACADIDNMFGDDEATLAGQGAAPDAGTLAHYVGLLDSGAQSAAQLGAMAAETDLNAAHIGLVGLAATGIEYV